MSAPKANCTVRLVKDPITAPTPPPFFVADLLQMLHRLLQHGNFCLNSIHAPIKANIVSSRACACMKGDAHLAIVVPPHFGVKILPLYRDVQIQGLNELPRLGKLQAVFSPNVAKLSCVDVLMRREIFVRLVIER